MIKFLTSIFDTGFWFSAYIAVMYFVFGMTEILDQWWLVLVLLGITSLSNLGLFYNKWTRRKKEGLITVKKPSLELSIFADITFYTAFVIYSQWEAIIYFIPVAAFHVFLMYKTQQHQYYYIAEDGIEDLNTHSNY